MLLTHAKSLVPFELAPGPLQCVDTDSCQNEIRKPMAAYATRRRTRRAPSPSLIAMFPAAGSH
jgi:hypothetical protein